MDRRSFVTGLGGGLAWSLTVTSADATPGRSMLSTYVTNITDVLGTEALPVGRDAAVRLVRLPTRAYDPNTVAVVTEQGQLLGYLPTNQSKILSPILEAGLPMTARVSDARSAPRPSVRVEVSIGGTASM